MHTLNLPSAVPISSDIPIHSEQPPACDMPSFAERVLAWFAHSGRHDLPWQQHCTSAPDPYRVWVSEIMLQQTQVTTVIPYFERFMQSFPTVHHLADAPWEAVANHWAGLGYYARARNLHKGAQQLVTVIEATGAFPQTVAAWQAISGVGQSTAGAIVAMGLHGHGVICDGNVKRVLTRWAGISDDISTSATTQRLWALATQLTPADFSGEYAQAMMDLGATLCTRTRPTCLLCPVQADCVAHREGNPTAYPVKAKKPAKPTRTSTVLLLCGVDGRLLWLRRPEQGIWGGLWCLPLAFTMTVQEGETHANGKVNAKINAKDKVNADATDALDAPVLSRLQTPAEILLNEWLATHTCLKADWVQAITNATTPITINTRDHASALHSNNTPPNQPSDADTPQQIRPLPPLRHTLTHFHWQLQPLFIPLAALSNCTLGEGMTDDEPSNTCPLNNLPANTAPLNHAQPSPYPEALVLTISALLDKAGIEYCWLTHDEALTQLALPKAMMRILDSLPTGL